MPEQGPREGAELFRLLVQCSNDIIMVVDRDAVMRFIGGPLERILGWQPDRLLGASGFQIIHPDDAASVRRVFDESIASPGAAQRVEYRCRHQDGHWVAVEAVGTNLLADPLVGGVVLNIRDATERLHAQAALREREETLRALAENARDTIMRFDADGRLLYANPNIGHITEIPDGRLVGMTFRELGFPDGLCSLWDEAVGSVLADGRARRIEFLLPRGMWIDWLLAPELDADGRVKAVIASARDITQIKDVQRSLADSEARYRSIVDSSPMGIHSYALEDDGRLVFQGGNPAADRILGVDHGSLVGMTIEEAFPTLAASEIPDRYREVARTGAPWTTSQVDYADDRIRGAFDVYAFRISANRMAAVFLDVGDRLRSEEERRRLEAQLARSQKLESIGRLAGGVAHDFNNLLTAILGGVSLALGDLSERDPLRENLLDVQHAAESATGLTRQLLAFSRRQPAAPRVVDLNEIIRDSQRMLRRLIGEDVDLAFTPGAGLGAVLIDPGQVEQVLVNLCVNARDAMPEGGRLGIETSVRVLDDEYCALHPGMPPGPCVVLAVSDSGTGMTPEVKEHLFEPFYTTKPAGQGTGLGLATVFGIVKQNHGSIEVYSEPGMGSTFRLYLPRVDARPQPLDRGPQRASPRGTETVFVVEDEPIVRSLAVRVLSRQGYAVHAFPSGGEALMAIKGTTEAVHLLVTDVVLPGVNGRVLAQDMRALRPGLRVLFTSGYTEDIIAHHGVLERGIDFIGKPYTPSELAAKVRAVLDRSEG
jgi:two-component system, cell cycle sensor histidine kinase and response regulator CckA